MLTPKKSFVCLSPEAYYKMILHAVKYPHCAVNGVLLASTKSIRNKDSPIKFCDAVPLFHMALNLTPMAEIALMQISKIYGEDLCIAGYYTAHENVYETSFEKGHNRILDRIANNMESGIAYAFVINNSRLSANLDNIALKAAEFDSNSYKPIDIQSIVLDSDRSLDVCSRLIEIKGYERLIDFDNHLDNPTDDWRNDWLNKEIERLS